MKFFKKVRFGGGLAIIAEPFILNMRKGWIFIGLILVLSSFLNAKKQRWFFAILGVLLFCLSNYVPDPHSGLLSLLGLVSVLIATLPNRTIRANEDWRAKCRPG